MMMLMMRGDDVERLNPIVGSQWHVAFAWVDDEMKILMQKNLPTSRRWWAFYSDDDDDGGGDDDDDNDVDYDDDDGAE